MVGPAMMLLKMLHCKRLKGKKSSSSKSRDEEHYQGPSRRKSRSMKTELQDCEYDQNLCRVCLKEGSIPIFGFDDISEDLNTFAGIEISFDDIYPKLLCQSCYSLLQGAILFRKTAQQSDQLIKQRNQGNNSSADHDYFDTADDSYKAEDDYKDDDDYKADDDYKDEKVTLNAVETYYCKKCDLVLDTLEKYKAHRLSAEHDNLRKTCPVCKNSYNSCYLKKHMMLHKMETPYMCDICGKKFSINTQFNRHRVTHFLDLPFQCKLCPYRGRFSESLKSHMKTHTGNKPYQCPQCPTRFFTNKSNLNKHMLTHKTEHDFKCSQCERGFYRQRDLDLHYKVDHCGIKDHICNFCNKAFGYRKQMMKHQLKVHKRDKLQSGRTPLYLILQKKQQLETEQI